MNALIFLVPEDIVDVRAKLVSNVLLSQGDNANLSLDSYFCWELDESASLNSRLLDGKFSESIVCIPIRSGIVHVQCLIKLKTIHFLG